MDDPRVIAALIAAAVSIVLAVINYVQIYDQGSSIELLKHKLDKEKSIRDARIDYEYEARKRLYREYEPLYFLLSEFSILALNHIKGISWTSFKGKTKPEYWDKTSWMSKDSYYFKETIYKLFCPLAVYKLILDKITIVDINVDEKLFIQYHLCRILYFSFQQDYIVNRYMSESILVKAEHIHIFGNRYPIGVSFKEAYDKEWQKHVTNPDEFTGAEGIRTGKVDNIIEAFCKNEMNSREVINFSEFEARLGNSENVSDEFKILVDRFNFFDPEVNKILWRVLVVQSCIYHIFREIRFQPEVTSDKILNLCREYYAKYRNEIEDHSKAGFKANISEIYEQKDVIDSAEKYLLHQLKINLAKHG